MTEMIAGNIGQTSFLRGDCPGHNLLAASRRRPLPFVGNWVGLSAANRPSYASGELLRRDQLCRLRGIYDSCKL